MKKFIAFTLSEILVVVAIIGVVSALTVPNLVKNYQRDAYTVKLRKIVLALEEAADLYITENEKQTLNTTPLFQEAEGDGISNFVNSKLKISKRCDNSSECFATEYFRLSNGASKNFNCAGISYLMADSSAICIDRKAAGWLEIFLDTNGQAEPNTGGRDMFTFYLSPIAQTTRVPGGAANGMIARYAPACEACFEDHNYETDPEGAAAACYGSSVCTDLSNMRCSEQYFGLDCLEQIRTDGWKMNY